MKKFKEDCTICDKPIKTFMDRHNASPVGEAGAGCCKSCNENIVIPARLAIAHLCWKQIKSVSTLVKA